MICENCNKEHDGSYGSGRFCSSKCARAFSTKNKRKEINEKVSKTLKGTNLDLNSYRWKNHIKFNKIKFIEGHCEYCNKIINIAYKKKNTKHYCNGNCRNLHLNKLKICGGLFQGKNISQWEIILQDCLNNYNIKFEANNRIILKDGKELDIWLPDYKIGIELNGIWHYSIKPYNHNVNKFFDRIVKDILKDIEMKELGYKLYVIEDKDIKEDFKVFFNNFIEKYILNKV